jgi:hypothetical protein
MQREHFMKAVNIQWDTDGESVDLPTEIEIPDNLIEDEISDYEISNYISNLTGFCHRGFVLEK